MRVLGLDEAGRGAVLGPLVVAGVLLDVSKMSKLAEIGVRDSKELTSSRREALAAEILEIAEYIAVLQAPPQTLDSEMSLHSLNVLEARLFAMVIDALKPDKAIVDSPDEDVRRFTSYIYQFSHYKPPIIAENKADDKYPLVGAASIIAKVTRDQMIKRLSLKYGEIGSGYSSDPATRDFLERWIEENNTLPPIARRKWKTSQDMLTKVRQSRLELSDY
uniref:Ribonuclease HII n=1 Tax=uncultured korarchaeote TaxID=161241 RepID=A0A1L2JPU5_9CREN|nr:ribonuclease HII [uncultured korarchaeote]